MLRGGNWASGLILSIVLGIPATAVEAQPHSVSFDIPAQNLASAMSEFTRQSGLPVMAASDIVAGRSSNRISGYFTPDAALKAMLAGTGLKALSGPTGGYVLILETAVSSEETSPTTVVVEGKRPGVSDQVDKRVYDIKVDPQSQGGLVADILIKLPSVSLVEGNRVAIRGNPNVTILVDGKPPINGNAILQTLPASEIDRIEVITNPSARYTSAGSGGIINIITKSRRPFGVSGSLNPTVLNQPAAALSSIFTVKKDRWVFDDRLNYSKGIYVEDKVVSILHPTPSAADTHRQFHFETLLNTAKLSFKPDDARTFTAYNQIYGADLDADIETLHENAAGHFNEMGTEVTRNRRNSIGGIFEYSGGDNGVSLKLDGAHFQTNNRLLRLRLREGSRFRYDYQLTGPQDVVKMDYERGSTSGSTLSAGLGMDRTSNRIEQNYHDAEVSLAPIISTRSYAFSGRRTIAYGYVTYQRDIGDWTTLAGLRMETEQLDLSTEGREVSRSFEDIYPSLHVSRNLDVNQKLKLSYAKRITRPGMAQFNPVIVYTDSSSAYRGNPDLMPSTTDAFEINLNRGRGDKSLETTAYYRFSDDRLTTLSTEIAPGVILTEDVNAGSSRVLGFEVSSRGHMSRRWKYATSVNLFSNELTAYDGEQFQTRELVSTTGNAVLEFAQSPKDTWQASLNFATRTLTPQGHREASFRVDTTLRRKLTDTMTFTATAYDIFGTNKQTVVIDTPRLRSRLHEPAYNRYVMLALFYTFGGK